MTAVSVIGAESKTVELALTKCLAGRCGDAELAGLRSAGSTPDRSVFRARQCGAVGELAADGVRCGQGQGGLADPSRPGQRHQAHLSPQQHPGDRSQFLHPVHERSAHDRQWRGGRC